MFKPRTIRGQLIAGLIIFELLVLAGFAALLVRDQNAELSSRVDQRLKFQASQLAVEAESSIQTDNFKVLQNLVSGMTRFPIIQAAQVTDLLGRTIVSSHPSMNGRINLTSLEKSYLRKLDGPTIFPLNRGTHEVVAPVRVKGRVRALVWIYPDESMDRLAMHSLLRLMLFVAIILIAVCTLLASVMARTITRPLEVLMRAARQVVRDPEDMTGFPLPVTSSNEAAELTMTLNLMVASIEEQRAGLNDTLALLDSMLANAPIGFAFFDRKSRFVRINQFMAEMNRLSISRHLGRTLAEVLPADAAATLEPLIDEVFKNGIAVRDLELNTGRARTWLVNIYPVRTGAAQVVRWAGVIVVDTTDRKHSEEALRRTEKLAVAGRLAASIAHEINNPLEAVTNLIYLLHEHPSLDAEALAFAELAQHEVARVSDIAQQTLRFYKQSTLPVLSSVGELLDSVLTLHHGRVQSLQVEVVRKYRGLVELFCFAGELRQLFANLIGNALDAMMPGGGRLTICIRRSWDWSTNGDTRAEGVRITVADTGCGMDKEVMQRIFEPFFTTKEATGTGLGLWVSEEIVAKHCGSVRIRSRAAGTGAAGRPTGTVFMLFFPSGSVDGKASNLERASQMDEEKTDTLGTL